MWETIISVATTAVGALVWSFKQQSRINELFVMAREREKYDALRQAADDQRHRENKDALRRIEEKMDSYCALFMTRRKEDHAR